MSAMALESTLVHRRGAIAPAPPARRYTQGEIEAVYRVIAEGRDMRHFLPDPIDPDVVARLLQAAHQAPSVGLMQPWRFVRVTDPTLRRDIHALVAEERQHTAAPLGARGGTGSCL